ncbi:Rieske (2Fe-2S) protein [Celeribacter neptunius]|uniref:Rieske [2Fe-2S] domain-containing protein n=1 Tax=Celeribacter neptunius TaxID=588602 RepID=A0A1I3NMS4_9RHOB|nr:Rieske (2Fe-2S) protein [Celeribacter neptunius]SFJ10603.1 Rieske [2Fe-2S] domain-containing protein [Celeribacter neptunius]
MTQTGWVPVALSKMIEPGTSAGVVAEGAEIVVWRDTSGTAHAWEDRCPHRGMKMSFGFVRGDHIACLYHGWEYDESGTCQYIPAHPDLEVPKSICVARYGVAESGGMIWAHLPLGSEPAAASELPVMEGLRSLYLDAPLADVIAALGAERTGSMIAIEHAGVALRIGVQAVSERRSALHITLPEGTPDSAKPMLLDWCEALRRQVEAREAVA